VFQNIVLAHDGTTASHHAFMQALDLARQAHRPLHVVAVAWTAEVETRVGLDAEHRRCDTYLHELLKQMEAEGVELELEVREGIPSEQIVAVADELHADLLVVGHRHRTLVRRMADASVAKRVIDHARCPVMVTT
jgi:nucleotide-binding universal stress UspA family protein